MLISCTGPSGRMTFSDTVLNGVVFNRNEPMILVILGAQIDADPDRGVLEQFQQDHYDCLTLEDDESVFSMDRAKLVAVNLQTIDEEPILTFVFTDDAKVQWAVGEGQDADEVYNTLVAAWKSPARRPRLAIEEELPG